MLKILQARLQQYVNHECPDTQAGFRKGTRDQIADICWIIEKAGELQKNLNKLLDQIQYFFITPHFIGRDIETQKCV